MTLTPTPPLWQWKCKYCDHESETLGDAFVHVRDAHGIDPLAPIKQGAA